MPPATTTRSGSASVPWESTWPAASVSRWSSLISRTRSEETATMRQPAGMTVATLTLYDREGRVDTGLARTHAAWLAEAGIPTLAPVGTTGEALYLDRREK